MKKRSFISLIILLIFFVSIPVVLSAQSKPVPNSPDDFRIANSSLGGVRITSYLGTRQDVVIPETIDGLGVTEISDRVFDRAASNKIINNIVLPNTLIKIGKNAFRGQTLVSISFPSSLRIIDEGAFFGNKFTSVVIPNGVTLVGPGAFGNRTGESHITTIVIPPSLAIDVQNAAYPTAGFWNAFIESGEGRFATSITSITLPANVPPRNFVMLGFHQFHSGFHEAYEGNGKKAGTYIWTGRIWVVQ